MTVKLFLLPGYVGEVCSIFSVLTCAVNVTNLMFTNDILRTNYEDFLYNYIEYTNAIIKNQSISKILKVFFHKNFWLSVVNNNTTYFPKKKYGEYLRNSPDSEG